MTFRTATGQTGLDAYKNEAIQIANAQRALDRRMQTLLTIVHDEAPELFECSTDYDPQLDNAASKAKGFCHYLCGHDDYVRWLRRTH